MQNAIENPRGMIEEIAKQQGLSEEDTQHFMAELDAAVQRRLERNGHIEHQKLQQDYAQTIARLRAEGASRQTLEDVRAKYLDAGLGYPERLAVITADELLDDILPNMSNAVIAKPLISEYRREMLAAAGSRERVLQVKAKYKQRGLDVDTIPLYGKDK